MPVFVQVFGFTKQSQDILWFHILRAAVSRRRVMIHPRSWIFCTPVANWRVNANFPGSRSAGM